MQSWAQKHECLHLVYAEYDVEAFGLIWSREREDSLVPVTRHRGDGTHNGPTWDHTDPRTNLTTHKHPSQPVPTHKRMHLHAQPARAVAEPAEPTEPRG